MNKIVEKIIENLKREIDLDYKKRSKRFFKEPVNSYGVSIPKVRKIAKKIFCEIESFELGKFRNIIEELLETRIDENINIAFFLVEMKKDECCSDTIEIYEKWIDKYVTNWGTCDNLCTHALGYNVWKYPAHIRVLKVWATSKNMWLRRASAVSMIYSVRKGENITEILEMADILLNDKEDLVQKGYGWMLKEASKNFPDEVFNFIIRRNGVMPRTALRYAIEKMSKEKKHLAMKKD